MNFMILEQLLEMGGETSLAIVEELIEIYQTSSRQCLRTLKGLLDQNAVEKFVKEAHFFKSSSMGVGALAVTEVLRTMENFKGASQLPPAAFDLYSILAEECDSSIVCLHEWLATQRSQILEKK